ncbi:hypothetical protein HHK36_032801 [Tetracentron sinense]|uniref:Uncharacterized protein n=1 Tax=Tetracentron sinense TaxID=13715 RepID=A0A834Y740_TETSI|nr:hypothetical protein HHK36_032801 [Tetracentron sinense]
MDVGDEERIGFSGGQVGDEVRMTFSGREVGDEVRTVISGGKVGDEVRTAFSGGEVVVWGSATSDITFVTKDQMGFLDKLWDDTLAGPTPETGLGKLRKYESFSATRSPPIVSDETPISRSITILKNSSNFRSIRIYSRLLRPDQAPRRRLSPGKCGEGGSGWRPEGVAADCPAQ